MWDSIPPAYEPENELLRSGVWLLKRNKCLDGFKPMNRLTLHVWSGGLSLLNDDDEIILSAKHPQFLPFLGLFSGSEETCGLKTAVRFPFLLKVGRLHQAAPLPGVAATKGSKLTYSVLICFFSLPLSHNEESLNISVTETLDSRSLLHNNNNNKSYL